ncbi:MAG: hypothetical protein ACM31D_11850 [Bacteroidota bacterium]
MRAACRLGGLLLAGLLAGCAPANTAPPTLTLAATNCDAAPNLALAEELPLGDKNSAAKLVDLKADGPCLRDGEGRARLYTLFRLPADAASPFTLRVSSPAQGKVVMAPKIALLTAEGGVAREIADNALLFRGGALGAMFRLRSEDRYLLVTSDPDRVGKKFMRTATTLNSSTVSAGRGVATFYSADDQTSDFIFSHTGKLDVRVDPLASAGS